MSARRKNPAEHPELGLPEVRPLWQKSGLFSDHYLKVRIAGNDWWPSDDLVRPVWAFCKGLVERRAFGLRRHGNEEEARQELIEPLLERLGLSWSRNLGLPDQDLEPDYILFASAQEKAAVQDKDRTARYKAGVGLLEAKKYGHPLSQISRHQQRYPHLQIRDYLSEARVLGWGILTNGRDWRLYCRDARPSDFFELNLEVAVQSLQTFKLFYSLFHRDAFIRDTQGKCRLDRVREGALSAQTELESDLRERVFTLIANLANGFAGRPENGIADTDLPRLYDNCLIYLYRLLFILYAEGRELLPVEPRSRKYSKELSLERLKPALQGFAYESHTQTRLYRELGELCHVINGTNEKANKEFGVPRYNGGLFDPKKHRDLETWAVSDAVLADVLRGLMFNPPPRRDDPALPIQTVDYADLNVQQLGSIYEGLLENHFERENGRLVLKTDKAERKATGTYYTPDHIVKYIVEHTVGALLAEIGQRPEVRAAREAGLQNNAFADAVLALNVCDPAMGSGHFLVEAVIHLADAIVYHPSTKFQAEFERGESQERAETAYWRRRVVESCIYGVDLNPLAVELSKLSLWLTCIASAAPLSFLDHHLRCGNSLIGARLTDLGGLPEKKKKKTAAEQMSLNFGPDLKRAISEAISGIRQIEGTASGTVSEVKDKEKRWMEQVLPVLVPYRAIADLWTRTFFGEPLSEEDYLARAQRILDACRKDPGCVKDGGMRYHIKELEKPFFHWELEFPEVFFNGDGSLRENPGFDAVIGNPPYVRPHKIALVDKEWLWRAFEGYKAKTDLLNCFLEQAVRLCAETRYVSMITSDTWRTLESSVDFRALLLDRARVMQIVLLPCGVFIDVAVRPVVVVLRKDRDFQARNGNIVSVRQLESIASAGTCSQSVWMDDPRHIFDVARQSVSTIRTKITGTSELLGDIVTVDFGLKTGDDEKFVGAKRESSEYKKLVSSRSIGRYCLDWEGQWVWYRPDLMRANKGTARPGETARFERDKVVLSRMADGIEAALDREEYYVKDALLLADARNGYSEAYILALLNSYLLRFWYLSTFTTIDMHRNVAMRLPIRRIAFTTPDAERKRCAKKALQTYDRGLENGDACPILAFAEEHLEASRADVIHDLLAFLAERMTAMNTEKHAAAKGFLTDLKDFRGVDAHSLTPKTRLDAFWKLEAGDVFAHLNANRKALAARGTRLNASDEESIRARFQKAKAAIVPLETQIAFTDRLIDQIVYRLYSLTPEEIGIVEGGT